MKAFGEVIQLWKLKNIWTSKLSDVSVFTMTVEFKSTLDQSTSYVIHLCISTVSVLNECILFCSRILTHHRFPANLSNQEASSKFSIHSIIYTLSSPTCTVKCTAISHHAPITNNLHQRYFGNVHRDEVRQHDADKVRYDLSRCHYHQHRHRFGERRYILTDFKLIEQSN